MELYINPHRAIRSALLALTRFRLSTARWLLSWFRCLPFDSSFLRFGFVSRNHHRPEEILPEREVVLQA